MAEDDTEDRRWAVGLGISAFVVLVVVVLAVVVGGAGQEPAAEGPSTTRDLSTVTDEEMEHVVAENPDVVPMRLALVERYLRGAETEATNGGEDEAERLLGLARAHARQAEDRATTLDDKARALRYLGWTTALLGAPEEGEVLLIQSLGIDETNPDALYFLAYVRFELLGDAQAALGPLEALSGQDMTDRQRQVIGALLADVHLALGLDEATTTAG